MSKPTCIRVYNTRVMGEMAKGLLETNGIKSFISGTHSFSPNVEFAAGIRLWVKEEDKQKAIGILKRHDSQQNKTKSVNL